MLHNKGLLHRPPPFDLNARIHTDPFAALPYDVIHTLTTYLGTLSTFSLLKASPNILNSTTPNPTFWKRMIRWDFFDWYPEAASFFASTEFPEGFDFKRAYLWLGEVTAPVGGLKGEFMGVANRRRIWNACTELGEYYIEEIYKEDRGE